MHLTDREIWALLHGMLMGGPFLLMLAGSVLVLVGLRADLLTERGLRLGTGGLRLGAAVTAATAWLIVLIGVWVLLPWYQEATPESPRSILLADESTRGWHEFADVWKTHVAFMSPIFATAAAALVFHYGPRLPRDRQARNLVLALVLAAFAVASLAALLGSLVARAAPLR